MEKMGNFRGLPVFEVTDSFEWQNIKDNHSYDEKIYVYNSDVYYKGYLIAFTNGYTLLDFNEDLFGELRRKSWDSNGAELLCHVTGSAETRPQEEEKSESEAVETAGGTSFVDEFMNSWKDNIDNEIAMLKSSVAQMEDMVNAVG